MGAKVTENLGPEIKVTQFISTMEEGHSLIPRLLANPSEIEAVVLGAGYNPDMRKTLRMDTVGKEGYKQVPWLAADPSKVPQSLTAEAMENYSKEVSERTKNLLLELREKGSKVSKDAETSEDYLY